MKIILTIVLTILSIALLGFGIVFVSAFRTVKKRWRDRVMLLHTIEAAKGETIILQDCLDAVADRIVDPKLSTEQKDEIRNLIIKANQIIEKRKKEISAIKAKVEVENELEKYFKILSAVLSKYNLDLVRKLLEEMEKIIACTPEKRANLLEGIFSKARCMEDVTRIYREKAKAYHPDNGGDSTKFNMLQEEYKKAVCMMGRK